VDDINVRRVISRCNNSFSPLPAPHEIVLAEALHGLWGRAGPAGLPGSHGNREEWVSASSPMA